MKQNLKLFAFLGLIIVIGMVLWTADATTINAGLYVVQIPYEDAEDITTLQQSIDDIWAVYKKNQRLDTVLTQAEIDQLRATGRTVIINEGQTKTIRQSRASSSQLDGIPGYPCYRTVEETFETATQIVADYPTLADWIDVGDSWEKAAEISEGYDINVLILTNQENTTPDKPILFVTSAIHAREYTTAELMTRFAEYLVNNYGTDADATWILDHHEIHLMLQANPDGRKQAETGLLWRKNTNQTYCSATSQNRGVDLNRNFPFEWGVHNGSSSNECAPDFRGGSPASEPEVKAVVDYMRSIFPDQRGEQLTDAAPDTTSGIYLDVHSYSELVIWSWGGRSTPAPNGTGLQTLGRKLAFFNDYYPQQAIGLYATDGTTDDFGYGELGIPSYTYELGTSFFQGCSTFENQILPDNLQSLIYAAKVARTPYLTPAGPDMTTPILSTNGVLAGTDVIITANVDDTRYNNQNGTEPTQSIAAAELYINTPPWEGGTAIPMTADDSNYDTTIESVSATIDTAGFAIGNHILYVRGQDTDGNWGAVSATFLQIADPLVTPTATPTQTPMPPPPVPDENGVVTWCSDALTAIPDNGLDSSTITVSGNPYTITDLDVSIAAEHTWIGDLRFTLTHDGASSTLFGSTSCDGDDIGVVLDDSAATSATTQCSGSPAMSGTHRPSTPLSVFNDQTFDGGWTLTYQDTVAQDSGSITEWCLIATVGDAEPITVTPSPIPAVTDTPTVTATATPETPLSVTLNQTAGQSQTQWLLFALLPLILIVATVARTVFGRK